MDAPIRLLLADDSDVMRQAISGLLKEESRVTITGEARDYRELLELLPQSNPQVVLMDVYMPGRGEFDADTIKAQLGGCCLLAMSLFADEATARIARSYGASKLLDKISLVSTLMQAITECTRQYRSFTPSV